MLFSGGHMPAAPNPVLSVLADDTVSSEEFVCEHALSILIRLPNGKRWLFDTGTTDVYLENAKRMGESLDDLSGIVISHGHEDHTGGLMFYPRLKGKPPVFGHPYIWHKSYQVRPDKPLRITGIPYMSRMHVSPVFVPVNNTKQLDDDLYFFTDIPREPGSFAPTQGNFFNEDGTGPVPLIDDGSLVVETGKGLVVVMGCAHAGYTNILKAVHKAFPEEKLLAVIGGLHLGNASEAVLKEAADFTDDIRTADFRFYGGHCTGEKAIAYFKSRFGNEAVQSLGSGKVIAFK